MPVETTCAEISRQGGAPDCPSRPLHHLQGTSLLTVQFSMLIYGTKQTQQLFPMHILTLGNSLQSNQGAVPCRWWWLFQCMHCLTTQQCILPSDEECYHTTYHVARPIVKVTSGILRMGLWCLHRSAGIVQLAWGEEFTAFIVRCTTQNT